MAAKGIGHNPTLDNIYQTNNQNNLYDMAQNTDRNYNYNYYDSAVPFNENLTNQSLGESLAGSVGHFNYGNRRPSNLTQDMGASMYRTPPVYPGQRNIHEGFGTADVSSTFPSPEKKGMFDNFSGIIPALLKKLPRQDPRQVALTEFYGGKNNLQGGQTIQGGLMAGYNPVSGGFLNTVTGGKFGDPTNYGLQKAYDKRIKRLDKTISGWEETAAGDDLEAAEIAKQRLKTTALINRRKQLKADKAAELAMLNKVPTTGEGGKQITDDGKTGGDGGFQPVGHYGAAQGTKGSWTPGGSYKVGGRIGYNRGRVVNPGGYAGEEFEEFEDENTLDFMRDQGVPHSEMAEISPFEARIQELVDEGMSWQQAYQIAAQEFGMAEGQEDSFSEEGIASLV